MEKNREKGGKEEVQIIHGRKVFPVEFAEVFQKLTMDSMCSHTQTDIKNGERVARGHWVKIRR